jgi:hypothetical protein
MILATEGNLALIGVKHCTFLNEPSIYTHFVYRAPFLGQESAAPAPQRGSVSEHRRVLFASR